MTAHNKNKTKPGTMTIEYIMVLVLVIGLGASLVALQTSLSNTIKKTSANIANTTTSTVTNSNANQTSGNLIQTSNSTNGTESNNTTNSGTTNATASNSNISVLELNDGNEDDPSTAYDMLYGIKTDFDTSNTKLQALINSVGGIKTAIIGNNTSGTMGIINAIKTTDTNDKFDTLNNTLLANNDSLLARLNDITDAIKLTGGGSVTVDGDNGTLTTENQTTLTTSGTLSGNITWSSTTGEWTYPITVSTSNFQDDAVLIYYWTYDGVKTDNTTLTYTPTKDDIGHRIAFVVKDKEGTYTGSVARAVTITQAELTGTLTINKAAASYGDTLTVTMTGSNNSNWTYQWYDNDTAISGATSNTYIITSNTWATTTTVTELKADKITCVATIASNMTNYYTSEKHSIQSSNNTVIAYPLDIDNTTWASLKTVANDLSTNGASSRYYTAMISTMRTGLTKTFTTTSSTVGTNVKVRIIGILQDKKTDGSLAGITFQTTHALATVNKMGTSKANTGGWGSSTMRTWLNSTVYNALPDDLKENIVSVKKYYQPTYSSTSSSTSSTEDNLFLLSARELYNYYNSSYPWYAYEGTGSSHNQQYAYYSYKGVTTDNYSLLKNMYLNYSGSNPGSQTSWWLRSVSLESIDTFWAVGSDGVSYNNPGYATSTFNVVPSFAF